LALEAKGNLSIVLVTGLPPEEYPLSLELCPAASPLVTDKSPTSVALASEANGNLSIVLRDIVGGWAPPEVYPEELEL
jgi:hypothetical protein